MFRFVKKIFISKAMFLGRNLPSVNSLECISMNNLEFKVRLKIVNGKVPIFFPVSVK